MTYTPQPGTVAARVVAWLQARPSGEYNASQIAEALKVDPKIIASSLEVALREKLVFHRQRDRTSPRAPWWYSARDREEHARRNGFAAAATWMPAQKINRKDAEESGSSPGTPGASGTPEVSSASSAEAAAADAPSGDEGAAADADRAAAPAPDTSAPGSQQVLKAEAARPDATDRETPDTASPGVGPMGAGQPADAGPTTDQRSGGVEGHAAANEARAYSKAIPTALDIIPSMRPEGVPPGETQSQGSRAAGVESGTLHQSAAQQGTNPVRRVGPAASTPAALLAASLRAAMNVDVDDDCLARGAELGRKGDQLPPADLAATRRAVRAPHERAPLAFRAARFSDGTLATERDGIVVAVYSAAEVDAIQKLLGVRG